VGAGERAQAVELLLPGRGRAHLVRVDAVDLDVPVLELVVPCRRADEPARGGDGAAVADADESDGACRGGTGIRRLEVDCGEVQGHLTTFSPGSCAMPQTRRRLAI